MRYTVICLLLCLIGCPAANDPGPIEDVIIADVVEETEYKQECKVEWTGCVTMDSFEELAEQVAFQEKNNTCTADHLLCIYLAYGSTGRPEDDGIVWEVVKFKTLDDIPRTSLRDSGGDCIIEYLNESL